MEKTHNITKKHKWLKVFSIVTLTVVVLLIIASNILVSAALVPSFMENLSAFEEITEESYAALVHTDDITQNKLQSEKDTKVWLEEVQTKKLTEKFTAYSSDGYELVARVYYQEQESHKWVILLHGYTGWKEEMNPIAYEYAKRGYQILTPDMRCQGESEGDFIGMGWTDRLDNRIWLEYILEQDPQAQIVLQGQSMGAACALLMAEEELPENVIAVVSDCAFSDAYEMFQKQMKDWFSLPAFPLLPLANQMLQLRGGYDLHNASPIKNMDKIQIPVLFIHGREDELIPAEMSREMYEAAACEKELLIMEGAGHAQSQDKNPELYYETIFSFLDKIVVEK